MIKRYPALPRVKLRVLLVHVPFSRSDTDLTAGRLSLQWLVNKAVYENLIPEVVNTMTLFRSGVFLTPEELAERRERIAQVRSRHFNLIRFSGTGRSSPYLRELVYSANTSYTPIEAILSPDSVLYRYIKLFPVSDAILDY